MLGMNLVDRMVDAMVRPEFVMKGMQEGRFTWGRGGDAGATAAESSPTSSWSSERKGVDKAIFHLHDKEDQSRKTVAIVFERSGFATWKMTEVRLPLNR